MVRIRGDVIIDASAGEVFDFVADERNEPTYNPRIVRAEKSSSGPVGAGSRFVSEPKSIGRSGTMTLEIIEYDRPHRLHNRVCSRYMQVDGTLIFDELGGRTRLRWDWDMDLVGPWKVLSPVLAVLGPPWERRNWVGLKRCLETRRS